MAQLEPASPPTNNLFHCSRSNIPLAVFVNSDTNATKSFEVDCLLNKQIIKKDKGCVIKYLVCWTGYGSE